MVRYWYGRISHVIHLPPVSNASDRCRACVVVYIVVSAACRLDQSKLRVVDASASRREAESGINAEA